jgi:hypothetical protein
MQPPISRTHYEPLYTGDLAATLKNALPEGQRMHISWLENLKRTPVILTIRRSCPPSRLPIRQSTRVNNFAPQQLGSFCKSEGLSYNYRLQYQSVLGLAKCSLYLIGEWL